MATRIRYKETKTPGVMKSVEIFTNSRGTPYYVKLNLNDKTFEIIHRDTQHVVKRMGENINNLNVLKRTVRKELEKLGVSFDKEVRDRTFGRCDKGYTEEKHTKNQTKVDIEALKREILKDL